MKWQAWEAIELCKKIEAIAPEYGAHVALTGGLLYKDGERKDADILFYTIRQWDEIDRAGLLCALAGLGIQIGEQKGWVNKARYQGKGLDMFFPEAFPASSAQLESGEY
jgi:hypothetical protein